MTARGRSEQLRAADVWRQLDGDGEVMSGAWESGLSTHSSIWSAEEASAPSPSQKPRSPDNNSSHRGEVCSRICALRWKRQQLWVIAEVQTHRMVFTHTHTHTHTRTHAILKCPCYGYWKVNFWGFGSPKQQAGMHATLLLSYNMHYFYLICSTTSKRYFFQKPRLYMTIICCDWSISLSAVLLCVHRYLGNIFVTL